MNHELKDRLEFHKGLVRTYLPIFYPVAVFTLTFYVLHMIGKSEIQESEKEIIYMMSGSFTTFIGMILSSVYGTSGGSKQKDEIIHNLSQK